MQIHFGNHLSLQSSMTARQNEEKVVGGSILVKLGKVLMKQPFQILLLDEGKHCWIIQIAI